MNTASAIDKNGIARRLLFLYFLFLAADLLFVALQKDHWRFLSKFLTHAVAGCVFHVCRA